MIYLDQVRVDLNPAEETLQANHYRKLKFTSNACRTTPHRDLVVVMDAGLY